MTTATRTPAARRWASLAEGAEYIDVAEKTLRRMIAAGTVTGYRLGLRSLRVDLNELDALLRPIPNAKTEAPEDVNQFAPSTHLAQPMPARAPRHTPSPRRTPAGE